MSGILGNDCLGGGLGIFLVGLFGGRVLWDNIMTELII